MSEFSGHSRCGSRDSGGVSGGAHYLDETFGPSLSEDEVKPDKNFLDDVGAREAPLRNTSS